MFRYGMNDNSRYAINDRTFRSLGGKEDEDAQVSEGRALSLPRQIDHYERKFLNWLVNMHNATSKHQVSLDEVRSLAELLQDMKKEQTDDYYEALVKPEYAKGAKIPSAIPVPSSSFQLHSQVTVGPNSQGNAFVVFNPFYLQTSSAVPIVQGTSTFFVNNSAALTGAAAAAAGTTLAVSMGQTIPAVYNQYRAVSASIIVKYVGRLDIVQGVIGGAIIFDPNIIPTATGASNDNLAKYGDFNLAMDSYFYQENLTLNGMRELYFPLDNTYEQYQNPGTAKNGFGFLIYIQDGVPTASNYKIDVYVNFEALPDAAFLNYIPQSPCKPIDQQKKEEAVRAVQAQPITSIDIERTKVGDNGWGFWDKLKGGLGSVLPSIGTLASMIPGIGKIAGPLLQAAGGYIKQNNPTALSLSGNQSDWRMVD